MDSAQDTACAVGCPIRRSRDQRSLASPPGFSQRATSFIASQCQGIHQMPFFRASRATPNGKNHRGPLSALLAQRLSRLGDCDAITGAILSVQKTLRDGTHRPETPLSEKPRPRLPSRSHNSLLHNCPSATPRRSKTGREFGHSAAMSKLFPPAFGACCASACRAAKALLSPGVEVNGLEPSTSCLQSRRSPS